MPGLENGIFVKGFRKKLASGLFQMSGFASSALLMGLLSLVSVQAMVVAGGAQVWGAIALGQAIGLVSAMVVNYGWNRAGPARVACASPGERRQEYVDSIRVRFALLVPTAVVAAMVAGLPVPDVWQFAAAGSLVTTANGLTGIWYFIGLGRSYLFFFLEAMPRAMGTAVGIAAMKTGLGVYLGLACIGIGVLVGFAMVTMWVYRSTTREDSGTIPRRRLRELLVVHRQGVSSTVASTIYIVAPLTIVSVVAPVSQPVFALADKMFRQFGVVVSVGVSSIQGWVPRVPYGRARFSRARAAIAAALGLGTIFGLGIAVIGGRLLYWMGDGQISTPYTIVLLVAGLLVVSTLDAVLGNAVLAAVGRLDVAVRATYISAAIGLPLVAVGAIYYGAAGALTGVIVGLVVRIAIELVGYTVHEKAFKPIEPGLQ